MPKFFDIIPPQPKKTKAETKKSFRFLWLLIIILPIILLFGLCFKAWQITREQITKSGPAIAINGAAKTTIGGQAFRIRLLDGSGKPGEIDFVKQFLSGSGDSIEQTGEFSNISDITVIYYKNGRADDANIIADNLKNNLHLTQVTTEESDTLGQTYDFLIVLGKIAP